MIKVEISADSERTAREIAKTEHGLYITRNVTTIFKKNGCPMGDQLKVLLKNLMVQYRLHDIPGAALMINLAAGVPNQRKRPYAFKNLDSRRLKFVRWYTLHFQDDLSTVLDKKRSKRLAARTAKQLVARYRKTVVGRLQYLPVDESRLSFVAEYTNKHQKIGCYIVFGNPSLNKHTV